MLSDLPLPLPDEEGNRALPETAVTREKKRAVLNFIFRVKLFTVLKCGY